MFRILAFAGVAMLAALSLPATRAVDFLGGAGLVLFGPAAIGGLVVTVAVCALFVWIVIRNAYVALKTREAAIVTTIAALAAVIACSIAFGVYPASAAETTAAAASAIVVPWGDWLGQALTAAATALVLVLTRLASLAPPLVRSLLTDAVISRAVDYAIATTRDAVSGKTTTILTANQLIAGAAVWIIDNEPRIAKWAGANLRPLIVARLSALNVIPPEASDLTLAIAAPARAE